MLCEKCQKNTAVVHMQQIVNGIKTEIHLCPACSLAMVEIPVSFEKMLQGVLDSILSMTGNAAEDKESVEAEAACKSCGMTYSMFKSGGKIGCADCYRTFSNEIEALLKNVQGSVRHEGKFPKRVGVMFRQKREADRLRVLLKKAIDEENFEEAANLRDKIKVMEN
jgi:protein arginine kinase activator